MFKQLQTKLLLLAMIVLPISMMAETTVSYGWETSDDATNWTISEAIEATSNEGNTGSYAGKINSNHTYVQFKNKVYVTSFSFAFKRTSSNSNYNVYIETSTDGTNWTAVETYAMSSFHNGTYSTKTHTFDGSKEYYVRFHCYNTTAVRYVDDVTITYSDGASNLEDNDLSLSPTSLKFDLYNDNQAKTITVSTSSEGEISVSNNEYVTTEVNGNTITVTPGENVTQGTQTITVTQASDGIYASGSATFTVDITDSTPFNGGDVTFDASKDSGTSPLIKNGVSFACSNGVLNNGSEYRLYKNSVTTFSVSDGTITKIAFTGTSSNPVSGFGEMEGLTINDDNGTWTGSAQSVSFTASDAQVRATKIVVTVDLNSTPIPSLTANNVSLAYNATSGQIEYTLSNPTNDGVLSVSENVEWISNAALSNDASVVTFNTTANDVTVPREGIITLTYTYGNNETVTKDVTVTQAAAPVIYSTIPALFAAATDTDTNVHVTFNNWVVSGVSNNGRSVFVTDNNGNGFVIYYNSDMSSTFAAGNVLSGTAVSCTLKKYNGFAELLNVNASDLTITTGGTVATANVAIADLAGVNTGALVSYENLTCSVDGSKYYLSDGTTTLQVYSSIFAFDALETGKTYNITGIYQQYNNTKEILPRSASDIEKVEAPVEEYTLTVNASDNVEIFTFVGDSTDPGVEGATTLQVNNGTEVGLSVSAAEGYTLTLMVDGEDVTSLLDESGYYTFTMPAHDVTVTATAEKVVPFEPVSYTLATSIKSGKSYIITSEVYDDKVFAMGEQKNNNRASVSADVEETTVTVETADVYEFVISSLDETTKEGKELYSIFDARNNGYLYAASGSNNYLRTQTKLDDNGKWTIEFDEDGVATLKAQGSNSRNWMRYNSSSDLFSCYSTGMDDIYLYEKVVVETATITLNPACTDGEMVYGTYSNEHPFVVSDDIVVAEVGIIDGALYVEEYEKGDIVPANTGVMVSAVEGGDYEVTLTSEDGESVLGTGNCLLPSGTNGITAEEMGDDSNLYYRLTMHNGTQIGFWWGAADGAAFSLAPNKAYLAVPKSLTSRSGFTFGGNTTTAIQDVDNMKQSGCIFNLQGQRVVAPQKGMFIVDGKKVVKK